MSEKYVPCVQTSNEGEGILSERQSGGILYFLTGFHKGGIDRGFGHASRALAISGKLPANIPITYSAWVRDPYLTEQFVNPNARFIPVDIIRDGSIAQNREAQLQYFLAKNDHLQEEWSGTSMVIVDFLPETRVFRKFEERHGMRRKPVLGVYQSFAETYSLGNEEQDTEMAKWQEDKLRTVESMDTVLLTDIFKQDDAPFTIGKPSHETLVVPVPPIVRGVTKTAEEIKGQYGISQDSKLIIIDNLTSPTFQEFLINAATGYASDVSFLIRGRQVKIPGQQYPENIVFVEGSIPDMQNVIAASDGVLTKPGTVTLMDCLVSEVPILFRPLQVGDDGDRMINTAMLHKAIGSGLPLSFDLNGNIKVQLDHWLEKQREYKASIRDLNINPKGAQIAASKILNFLSQTTDHAPTEIFSSLEKLDSNEQ